MKKTAFNNIHKELKAKLVEFAGFEMPVQYEGILSEHKAVRESVGVFDVSHMGEVEIRGKDAFEFVQKITTNDVSKLSEGKVQYSSMCYEHGGMVDDLLVYHCGDYYMLVINASNIEKDINWMKKNVFGDVKVIDISDATSLLAVQGKNSIKTLQKLTNIDLSSIEYYSYKRGKLADVDVIISHTGYTGEKVCFEIYMPSDVTISEKVWREIFKAGEEFNIKPVGLGARDTLRLEAAYRLYGNDMDENTNPLEAGLGWITKLDKEYFIGKDILLEIKNKGLTKKLVGFISNDKIMARHNHEVYINGEKVGYVTSGGPSPILNKNIGFAYIKIEHANIGNSINIKIRDKMINAEIVKTPFIPI